MLGIIKALIMNSAHRDIDLGRNTEKLNERFELKEKLS
jgi:hypothetical protein